MGKFKLAATLFVKKRENNGTNLKNLSGSANLAKLQTTNVIKIALPCGYFTGKFVEF